ncbi:hypothetical protein ACS0TY_025394 [Phlomoides rotata]
MVSSRYQPTQSCVLKEILDTIGALDKKVDALDKKVDALDNKVDALSKNRDGGVPEMNHNVETTLVEDGSGGVPKTNHNVETIPDEDNGVHTMDHTLETNPIEDGDGGASTKDNLLGVALEVEHEEVSLQIDTLDSKIEVHEEEDCRKDDKLNEVSDDDAQSSNENDACLLGRGHGKRKPAQSKCTPYTDPSKRKKLTNAIQFDAYRVVDSSKKDNLDKWLEKVVDGFDCGMFTVKFIEFLLAGKDVSLIRPDYMREWRKKLAADIFSQSFDL